MAEACSSNFSKHANVRYYDDDALRNLLWLKSSCRVHVKVLG